jgi:hypothetical protein
VLYCDNKCTNWPYDVRVTKSDGTTLLDYWRESYDANSQTIWIEVDSIPVGDFTGYVHVGDADATDVSSGANTFALFDDFAGTSIDSNKWTTLIHYGANITEDSGVVNLIPGSQDSYRCYLVSKDQYTAPYRIRARVKKYTTGSTDGIYIVYHWDGAAGGPYYLPANGYYWYWNGWDSPHVFKLARLFSYGESSLSTSNATAVDDNLHTVDIKVLASGLQKAIFDATEKNSATDTTRTSGYIGLYSGHNGETSDWYFLAAYTANEPTWGAWGSWEAAATASPPYSSSLMAVLLIVG